MHEHIRAASNLTRKKTQMTGSVQNKHEWHRNYMLHGVSITAFLHAQLDWVRRDATVYALLEAGLAQLPYALMCNPIREKGVVVIRIWWTAVTLEPT